MIVVVGSSRTERCGDVDVVDDKSLLALSAVEIKNGDERI